MLQCLQHSFTLKCTKYISPFLRMTGI
jgi:hypothetical protein